MTGVFIGDDSDTVRRNPPFDGIGNERRPLPRMTEVALVVVLLDGYGLLAAEHTWLGNARDA
jgi:hypothetical protein